jgi:lipoate-protein ligase A
VQTVAGRVWRQAGYAEADGALLLARNVAILQAVQRGAARPTLRWYRYERPCVVLGYGQNPGAVDLAACAAHGFSVLRRPAGGSAVLADGGLLGMSVTLPVPYPLVSDDLTESYRWLGETLAAALAGMGAAARLVEVAEARADTASVRSSNDPVERARAAACFGTFSPYEVAAGARKVVGLAQVRRRSAALFQVGVLLRSANRELAQVLQCPADEREALVQALDLHTVDLQTLLARPVAPTEVIAAVEHELERRWGVCLESEPLTASEEESARQALPGLVHLPAPVAF